MNVAQIRQVFPFSAIIGQESIKLSLLLNILDPQIGGVIVIGDRGSGKSTTVRALVDLLPEIEVVSGDPFMSHPTDTDLMSLDVRKRKEAGEPLSTQFQKTPIVDLPLGATEDRVCGTIDIEQALRTGTKTFEPGLLAQANRGILYIDEVNLLDDHLVDVLLDSAASGWNVVEREGISICHPARFILIGSGNPEEGELRPQLLDRFGLYAEIATTDMVSERVEIVTRRTLFDSAPDEFRKTWETHQRRKRSVIKAASTIVRQITISYDLRLTIAAICIQARVDGIRRDIVMNRSSRARRALRNRNIIISSGHNIEAATPIVTMEDVRRVALLCLSHRLRKNPLDIINARDRVDTIINCVLQDDNGFDLREF
jgi:magnesium chelatase subunit I